MKVICRYCRKLIEEKQAIKMSEIEYLQWNTVKTGKPYQISIYDNSYTQICRKCFKEDSK